MTITTCSTVFLEAVQTQTSISFEGLLLIFASFFIGDESLLITNPNDSGSDFDLGALFDGTDSDGKNDKQYVPNIYVPMSNYTRSMYGTLK